jgi:chaperone BCS1
MYTNDLPRTIFMKSPSAASNGIVNGKLGTIKESEKLLTPLTTPTAASHQQANVHATSPNGYSKVPTRDLVSVEKNPKDVGEEELKIIAREFSVKVPNDIFSPAEVQGFLLKRKTDPKKALLEVDAWVEGMVEAKRKRSKLLRVQ